MPGPVHPSARRLVAAVAATLVALTGCGRGDGDPTDAILAGGERLPGGITVTSTAFAPGEPIPERFSCEGENVPPPLRWDGVPPGTAEVALVIEDPDAPEGTFVHWLVLGVDPGAVAIEPTAPPPGEVLPGSSDNPAYIGPCPPDGDGPHRYFFEVYALAERPSLPPDGRPLDQVRAIRRAARAGGVLVGTFER